MPAFTISAAPGLSTVNCPADALVAPTPPTVVGACGNTLTPTNTPPAAAPACEGDTGWTFTYTDCADNTADWTYTYTVDMPAFTISVFFLMFRRPPSSTLVRASAASDVYKGRGNTLTPTN